MKLYRPVKLNKITQRFYDNFRPDLYQGTLGWKSHGGIDFAEVFGGGLYWLANIVGEVVLTGFSEIGGNYICLITSDEDGAFLHYFGHLQKSIAKVGQRVNPGDLIAFVDTTGKTFGSHTHYGLAKVFFHCPERFDTWDYLEPNNGYGGYTEPIPYADANFNIFILDYLAIRWQVKSLAQQIKELIEKIKQILKV